MDSNGCYWLDPASETVMIYLKQIARELSSRGFREVVFSEFRFPASNSISYHSEKSGAGADAGRGAGADDVLLREQSHDLV